MTQAIRCGTHHGGGFSCWHTRAVGWAVSAAFTFLPKIEGYGGGSRPFFLCLSSLSPSSFFTFLRLSLSFSLHLFPCLSFSLFLCFLFLRLVSSYFHLFRFLFLSPSFRAVSVGLVLFLKFLSRVSVGCTCQREMRERHMAASDRYGARVETTKNKQKCLSDKGMSYISRARQSLTQLATVRRFLSSSTSF